MNDLYALLGVDKNATEADIKRAYRKLARELHPDANPDDTEAHERFKEVSMAYEVLSDPDKRQRYDMFGSAGMGSAGGPGNAEDFFASGLGDIFEQFFGSGFGGGRSAGPMRGADAEAVVDLTFEEAVFGAEKEVRLRLPVTCATCKGSGAADGTAPVNCSQCGGTGEVRRVRQSILGQMVTTGRCNACAGLGTVIATPCKDCRGDGRRLEERVEVVTVPAGIDNGQTLRSHGRGAAGPRGGPAGDLYLHARVQPHDHFEREGVDVHTELHIPMTQAALGANVEVLTLEGVEEIPISPGTQSGAVLRLRGRGVPHTSGRGRGDFHIHLAVDTPTDLNADTDQLLRQFAGLRGEKVNDAPHGLFKKIKSAFS
ncbi:MAG TPA: molecular chaperone DnaJ [Acidimicrobiales bacterium]|nr:molecular chaperone DnaJ [Acidimicrobiales bacterium]